LHGTRLVPDEELPTKSGRLTDLPVVAIPVKEEKTMEHQRDELATKRDLDKVERKLTGRIDQVEQRLTDKIDVNSAKIDANSKKIDQVEQRLTDKIDANSAKIAENGKKIDKNSKKIDNLTIQVINNREEIRKRATREELNQRFDEVIRGQDKMTTILTRIDQERAATTARIDRIESDVERLKAR